MPRRRPIRPLTSEEETALNVLVRARSAEVRMVERARVILAVYSGLSLPKAGAVVKRGRTFVSQWLTRFESEGLDGLEDAPKSGRPSIYGEEDKGRLIATACTHPHSLDLPFGHWTLDRLTDYAHTQLGIQMSRPHIGRVLASEGLRWYQETTYFSERPDPQFAQKRGPSSHSTRSRPSMHTSSA